jgi:hypothetical protein
VKRLGLFRAAQEGALGVSIVELDHIVQRGSLSVTELRSRLGDLTKGLGAPETHGNCLIAKIAIACRERIVAEVSIDPEVALSNERAATRTEFTPLPAIAAAFRTAHKSPVRVSSLTHRATSWPL